MNRAGVYRLSTLRAGSSPIREALNRLHGVARSSGNTCLENPEWECPNLPARHDSPVLCAVPVRDRAEQPVP
jgi:hypothetical protein